MDQDDDLQKLLGKSILPTAQNEDTAMGGIKTLMKMLRQNEVTFEQVKIKKHAAIFYNESI